MNNVDKHPPEKMKTVIAEFYREDEILAAKNTLVQGLPQNIKGSLTEKYVTRRIGVHKVKNSVDDIFNLIEVIDSNGLREHLPIFCAANMARIPMMPEEMSDIASIRYELSMLRKQVEFLSGNLRPSATPKWKVDNTCEQRTMADDKDFPPLPGQHNTREQKQLLPADQPTKSPAQSLTQPNAEAPVDISQDNDGWEQPKKKVRKKNKKVVIGHSDRQASFTGVAKKSVVCVTRLKPGTPTDVSDYFKTNGVNVLSCFGVSRVSETEEIKYCSMRVCVYAMDLSKLYDSSLWPMGVVVRPWKFKVNS